MELRRACLVLCFLCLLHCTIQQNKQKSKATGATKKDVNQKVIDDLKKQIDDIWQELNLLKELQALQTVCLKGTKIHGKCFLAHTQPKRYHEASEDCMAQGGTLSVPRNGDENDSLFDYMRKSIRSNAEIWIGVNDMTTEGTWVDMAGASIRYKNWETEITAQPDGNTRENCGVMSGGANGKWFDESCRAQKAFVCEFNII
ncbi:tetranectin [Latimeria chalumnae]|uniref:C-type lectin domain family 3 member B n=1 Tax=Latimeria chalumnae TaxID=7897 RepID=H3AUM8_LATCH|nr:PREDICTED: tetranectin [Latimeria chalumnae]XP_014345713.1 PREDICTED: tetranectin [Latimeria chalumnae]|eukprot:XP_005999055.1 PREDICTED: tetranectin [Latimeria chalumnae]